MSRLYGRHCWALCKEVRDCLGRIDRQGERSQQRSARLPSRHSSCLRRRLTPNWALCSQRRMGRQHSARFPDVRTPNLDLRNSQGTLLPISMTKMPSCQWLSQVISLRVVAPSDKQSMIHTFQVALRLLPPFTDGGGGLGGTCPSLANVDVYLQAYWCDGWGCRWVTVASASRDVRAGGGAGNRVTARRTCKSTKSVGWRGAVDVDLIGIDDPPGYTYSVIKNLGCEPS
jgi:hypothetical protein